MDRGVRARGAARELALATIAFETVGTLAHAVAAGSTERNGYGATGSARFGTGALGAAGALARGLRAVGPERDLAPVALAHEARAADPERYGFLSFPRGTLWFQFNIAQS